MTDEPEAHITRVGDIIRIQETGEPLTVTAVPGPTIVFDGWVGRLVDEKK